MECKYIYKGTSYNSYNELVQAIEEEYEANEEFFKDITDIVYSLEEIQTTAIKTLKDIRSETLNRLGSPRFIPSVKMIDGEPLLSLPKEFINLLQVIDSDNFKLDGVALVAPMNREDYKVKLIELFVKDGNTELEALQKAQYLLDHLELIADDAKILHELCSNIQKTGYTNPFDFMAKSIKEGSSKPILPTDTVARELFDTMMEQYNKLYGRHRGVREALVVSNVVISSEIEQFDLDVIGNIDFVVVDDLGKAHVYVIKATETDVNKWPEEKVRKYKLLLALIKLMLKKRGLDVETLNIIPVRLKYDGDVITSARALEAKRISHDSRGNNALRSEEIIAQRFIPTSIRIEPVELETLTKVDKQLRTMFPGVDINSQGVIQSVDNWIDKNYPNGRIKQQEDGTYKVLLTNGESITVKDTTRPPKENKELREAVEEAIQAGEEELTNRIATLISDIRAVWGNAHKSNAWYEFSKKHTRNLGFMTRVLKTYMTGTWNSETKKFTHDWDMIENEALLNCGIILFQHRLTKQIDVITLSQFDVNTLYKIRGNRNIAGAHINDMDAGKLIRYSADYGNIETIRTLALLNAILGKNVEGEFGMIKVVSMLNQGNGRIYDLESVTKNCFTPFVKLIRNSEFKLENNLIKNKFINFIQLAYLQYQDIINYDSELLNVKFEQLVDPERVIYDEAVLEELIKRLTELRPALKNMGVKELARILSEKDPRSIDYKLAQLYYTLLRAYLQSRGEDFDYGVRKIATSRRYMHTANRDPDRNVRLYKNAVRTAINNTTTRVTDEFEVPYNIVREYLKAKGMSDTEKIVGGKYDKIFRKLFARDNDNKLTMEFINPYDYHGSELDATDLEFLKKMLYFFNKIRAKKRGLEFNFTLNDINSEAYKKFIEEVLKNKSSGGWFFWAPLARVSRSTARQHAKEYLAEKTRRVRQIISDPSAYVDEKLNDALDSNSTNTREEAADRMLDLWNPFDFGENIDGRNRILSGEREGAFETNVELLLAKFMDADIRTEELNRAMIVGRAVELSLELLGGEANSPEAVQQSVKEIHDYAKIAVFRTSIMEDSSKRLLSVLMPIRKKVTAAYLMGNVISAFRDTFEGLWLNMARGLNHYQTDISSKEVLEAYKEVVSKILTSSQNLTKIDLLCRMYALSNFDKINTAVAITQTRTGIYNWEEWAYATLRRPDFLNRMVLFVAQCIHDGCWDAISIDGIKLKYDWRKDKRFAAYAEGLKTGKTNTEEFKKAQALYYNAIREYNREHPDSPISANLDLPIPYSIDLVERFKNLSDSIYGAYDVATKAKYEWILAGYVFGLFSTWMNGQINNYMAQTDNYEDGPVELIYDEDEDGNELYLDEKMRFVRKVEHEDGTVTYEYLNDEHTQYTDDVNKLGRAMKGVPLNIQGIWYTCRHIVENLAGGKEELAKYKGNFLEWLKGQRNFTGIFVDNPIQLANLRKLFSDMIIWLLMACVFKFAITPAYKNLVKDAKANPDEYNPALFTIAGAIYKGGLRSYDGFRGIYNAIDYMGNNMDPPVYLFPIKLTSDLGKMALGDKTFFSVLTGNVAPFRMFLDTYKVYMT